MGVAALAAAAIASCPVATAGTRITLGPTRSYSTLLSQITGGMTPAQWYAYTPTIGQNWAPGTTPLPVDYPASLLPPFGPMTVGQSIRVGQGNLDPVLKQQAGHGPVVVAGVSQGAMVLDAERAALATDPAAPPPGTVQFVEFGNPAYGALGWLPPGTTIPLIDVTVIRPLDSQYNVDIVKGQYDFWADPPDRPWNVLADLNAIMGVKYVHISSGLDYKADGIVLSQTTNDRNATTTVYLVPTQHLPLTMPLRQLGVPDPLVDNIDAVLRPIIDAGYSRNLKQAANVGTAPTASRAVAGTPRIKPARTAGTAGAKRSGSRRAS